MAGESVPSELSRHVVPRTSFNVSIVLLVTQDGIVPTAPIAAEI